MKFSNFYMLLLAVLFIGCSESDDSGSNNDGGGNSFTLTLNDGSFWTYDVENGANTTRDSLYISNDTLINGRTYKKFKTKDNVASGFYSASLRNNGLRLNNNELLLSGDLSLAGGVNLPVTFDLTLDDFKIFKNNATVGSQLSVKSGIIQENVNGFPITVNYNLKSFAGENYESFTSPNGDSYSNVKSTIIRLNVTITTVQEIIPGFPINITVLTPQDVIVSTQYIASGIGVVHTNTDTSYSINTTIASELGIPASGSQNQKEFLDTYEIN